MTALRMECVYSMSIRTDVEELRLTRDGMGIIITNFRMVSTSYSYLTSIALLHKTQLQQRCARTHCVGVRARARNKERARCLFFGARTQIPGHNGRNWASTHFGRGVFCSSFAPSEAPLCSVFSKTHPSKKFEKRRYQT